MLGRRSIPGARLGWLLALALVAGCGGDGLLELAGQVTLDGAPLADGLIRFEPVDGKGPSAETLIAAGRYNVRAPAGQKTVRIIGYKTVGEQRQDPSNPESPMLPVKEEIVPAKYNTRSELKCDAGSAGPHDFALASK